MAIFPIIVYFDTKRARSSMTWREFVCAVRMRRNNERERPQVLIVLLERSGKYTTRKIHAKLHVHART